MTVTCAEEPLIMTVTCTEEPLFRRQAIHFRSTHYITYKIKYSNAAKIIRKPKLNAENSAIYLPVLSGL